MRSAHPMPEGPHSSGASPEGTAPPLFPLGSLALSRRVAAAPGTPGLLASLLLYKMAPEQGGAHQVNRPAAGGKVTPWESRSGGANALSLGSLGEICPQ